MAEQKRTPYESKRIVVGVESLKDFARFKHYRKIRESQVSRLKKALLENPAISGVLTINDVGRGGEKDYRLIDGNHRLEAVHRLIEEDPRLKFVFTALIYDHLSPREEVRLFVQVNGGSRVTPLDILYVRQEEFPIVAMLQKDFPCPVSLTASSTKEGFRVLTLLRAYLVRGSAYMMGGEGSREAEAFWRKLAALNYDDYRNLRSFATAFITGLGMPGVSNPLSRHTAIYALMKVYTTNVGGGHLTHDEVVDRWAQKVNGDPQVRVACDMSGLQAVKFLTDLIVTTMNRGHTRRLAVSPIPTTETGEVGNGRGESPRVASA